MANNILGQIRRSQILGYGPGSIIDFRAGDQGGGPVSVISLSLEKWNETAPLKFGSTDAHLIFERRLQNKLGVTHFRLPPIDDRAKDTDPLNRYLNGARFPQWLQCPKCGDLKPAKDWDEEFGDPSRWCSRCSRKTRTHVVPARFVIACENSHIDDFPWLWWLKTRSNPKCDKACSLNLESRGKAGLAGLILKCTREGCGAETSLKDIFGSSALKGFPCRGYRPWIGDEEECSAEPRVLQRGTGNLYIPVHESALSIPPWQDWIQREFDVHWESLVNGSDEVRKAIVTPLANLHGKDPDEMLRKLKQRIDYIDDLDTEDLRKDEYLNLIEESGWVDDDGIDSEFSVTAQTVAPSIKSFINKVVKVDRIREVRVQTAFKRIHPPASSTHAGFGQFGLLSQKNVGWLPAIEIRGEGIFVTLNKKRVSSWLEGCPKITDRCNKIRDIYLDEWESTRGENEEPPLEITPEFILLHSLAHLIIKQLALDSGYDAAAIRERIYSGSGAPGMCGLLIYTGSADSDGTLGGLARQAEPERIEATIHNAIEGARWCSSDPLCISGINSVSETYNLAACHSCILLPETSCEHYNRFLDRALLIGSPEDGITGFFDGLAMEVTS
jgi:hypothetical protein